MNRTDFIELAYEFPASLPPPKSEDYFRLPVKTAEEMGLEACVFSMRTSVRRKKQESIDDIEVHRFDDPFLLLLSARVRRPLIVHGHSFGWISSSAAPALFGRYVLTPHVYRLDTFNPSLTKLVTSMISKSRAVIVLTKFEARLFTPYVDEAKIHVIPHPIDFSFFSRAKKEEPDGLHEYSDSDDGLILSVANLVPRKNLETLIRGFELVNRTIPRSKLIIVGAEPPTVLSVGRPRKPKASYYQELRKLVSLLHLEKKVMFTGYRNSHDLRKFYAAADVFALPSTMEGQLLSAGEAAAAGLPLVLSNLKPLTEIYDGCALFHAPLDHMSLAHHLINVLTDEKLSKRLIHEGREKLKQFDVPLIKPKLKTVYEDCLKGN